MFHTGALVLWLIAAAVPAFALRNPLYLVLVLGASWIVYTVLPGLATGPTGHTSPMVSSWGSLVKISVFFFALTIPITALSSHMGRIVLFRLPQGWPIVGGAITLEAAIAGAVNGLALLTILALFAAFNAAVDHYQLLRATPAFLFQAGVVVSIAVTFVPQLVLSAKEIREAQRIRGHRFRGVRDLLPLVLPLLATSLERAIQLAETMEARGFGSAVTPASGRRAMWTQAGTLAGLLALLTGLFVVAYLPDSSLWGWALVALGTVGLVSVFWLQGKGVHRTRYRQPRWSARDSILAGASVVVIGCVVAARLTAPGTLVYLPYPPNSLLPPFNAWLGAALLLLATPALLAASGRQSRGSDAQNRANIMESQG